MFGKLFGSDTTGPEILHGSTWLGLSRDSEVHSHCTHFLCVLWLAQHRQSLEVWDPGVLRVPVTVSCTEARNYMFFLEEKGGVASRP